MNETLKNLYDRFYTPLTASEASQEVEDAHRQLIQRLNKPERKLILRIIDAKDTSLRRGPSTASSVASSWRGNCPLN